MRIAYISYEYPPDTAFGGIATYVKQAAALMATRGHQVEVFSASTRRAGYFDEKDVGVNLAREPDRASFREVITPIFADRHRISRFDVVESPEYFGEGRAIQIAYPRVPHVVKMHTPTQLLRQLTKCRPRLSGYLRHNISQARMVFGAIRRGRMATQYESYRVRRRKIPAVEAMELNCARESTLVVCPSESLRTWVANEWSIPIDKTMVVPNPYVPSQRLQSIQPVESPTVVGYLGRLEQRKGIEDFTKAIPLILAIEPTTRFRIVGDALFHQGTFERYDKYVVRRLRKYKAAIELVGARPADEMDEEYSKVDICVFPSIWENFPNVCLEAMAAGRAVVASDAGGMAEMLEGGKHGILIPPRNPNAIANAVLRLLKSADLCRTLGASARRRVLDAYNVQIIGPRMEYSYQKAVEMSKSH